MTSSKVPAQQREEQANGQMLPMPDSPTASKSYSPPLESTCPYCGAKIWGRCYKNSCNSQ